jgi:hypothetical protein
MLIDHYLVVVGFIAALGVFGTIARPLAKADPYWV